MGKLATLRTIQNGPYPDFHVHRSIDGGCRARYWDQQEGPSRQWLAKWLAWPFEALAEHLCFCDERKARALHAKPLLPKNLPKKGFPEETKASNSAFCSRLITAYGREMKLLLQSSCSTTHHHTCFEPRPAHHTTRIRAAPVNGLARHASWDPRWYVGSSCGNSWLLSASM